MTRDPIEHQLKERVKELKCLNELSRIAWDTNNDVSAVLTKVLKILPAAMQYTSSAQAKILVDKKEFITSSFDRIKHRISTPLIIDGTKCGLLEVGYLHTKRITSSHPFLAEEKNLLKTVAQELSLILKRSYIEDDKRKLQTQLQHSERLAFVGELSAGIAHELNEPLGRILGFAQLVKKEGLMSEQQNEDIERIIKASLYAREIIKKLMLFSRQMPQQIVSMNMNETIENILYFIDVRYHTSGIKMVRKLDSNLPSIKADPVQISQVVVNLITNAVHAMPNGGELLISTHQSANNVRLVVRDSGVGMTSEIRKRVFEPFFTTKPVGQGTGLGLSVVQGIVLAHHGTINVKSSPGKGSTFEILLPVQHRKGKKHE